MHIQAIRQTYSEMFIGQPRMFRAPGRINLIGEHVDYNNGFVLPAAIDKQVVFAINENNSSLYRFYASDLDQQYQVNMDMLQYTNAIWPNYLLGVVDQFRKRGYIIPGFDCAFTSDIPIGSGLSSSAALESGLSIALNEIFHLGESKIELVKLSQQAENEFVGVNCGIMDQFASIFGKRHHVFRLDCRSLEFKYFPLELQEMGILLIDTRVKHSLASSEYNTRRKECEQGVAKLANNTPGIKSLRDVSINMIEENRGHLNPTIYKRCRYVVDEIQRVLIACKDLENNDLTAFGQKMYETHLGLSKEYDVSCPELDFLVELAMEDSNILGSRMMGGGFGGCTVNLMNKSDIPVFIEKITKAFNKKFHHDPAFYEVNIKEGADEIFEF